MTLHIKKYGDYAYLTSTQTRYGHMTMFTPSGFFEENHKVPKEKTTMGFGENVYSKTNSAGYSRRETRCN